MDVSSVNPLQVKSLAAVEQAKLAKSHKADEVNQATSEEKKPYTSYDLTSITGPEIIELSDRLFNEDFYLRSILAMAVYCLSQ